MQRREEDHEQPSFYRVSGEIPAGAVIVRDPNTRLARHVRGTDGSEAKRLGFAHQKFSQDDVIWKSDDEPPMWKFHKLAPTHLFTAHPELDGLCAGVSEGGGLCGLAEILHIPAPISGEKNPYVAMEIRRLQKNLATDYQAARKFAAEYQQWSRLKNSTEENRAACRQHAMEWEARAHALKLALEGLK